MRLIAAGGHEVASGHYPLIVLVHASWLVALWLRSGTLSTVDASAGALAVAPYWCRWDGDTLWLVGSAATSVTRLVSHSICDSRAPRCSPDA